MPIRSVCVCVCVRLYQVTAICQVWHKMRDNLEDQSLQEKGAMALMSYTCAHVCVRVRVCRYK